MTASCLASCTDIRSITRPLVWRPSRPLKYKKIKIKCSAQGGERSATSSAAQRLFSNLNPGTFRHEPGSVFGASVLVGGTTVGAGILALPAVTQAAGFGSTSWMLVVCALYSVITGLFIAEVNINTIARKGAGYTSLVSMAECTLGTMGAQVVRGLYLFQNYALLVAYVARGSSVISELLLTQRWIAATAFSALLAGLCYFGSNRQIETVNSALVLAAVVPFMALLCLAWGDVDPGVLSEAHWEAVLPTVPILCLAFVYHNIVPVVVQNLEADPNKVRQAIAWGVVGPMAMYLAWDATILGALDNLLAKAAPTQPSAALPSAPLQAQTQTGVLAQALPPPPLQGGSWSESAPWGAAPAVAAAVSQVSGEGSETYPMHALPDLEAISAVPLTNSSSISSSSSSSSDDRRALTMAIQASSASSGEGCAGPTVPRAAIMTDAAAAADTPRLALAHAQPAVLPAAAAATAPPHAGEREAVQTGDVGDAARLAAAGHGASLERFSGTTDTADLAAGNRPPSTPPSPSSSPPSLEDPLELLTLTGSSLIQPLVQSFSFLAVATSYIGFVLAVTGFLPDAFRPLVNAGRPAQFALVVLPPIAMASTNPAIFLEALEVAGTYGVLTLYGIIPALMAWQGRYGADAPPLLAATPPSDAPNADPAPGQALAASAGGSAPGGRVELVPGGPGVVLAVGVSAALVIAGQWL